MVEPMPTRVCRDERPMEAMNQNKRILRAPQERTFRDVGVFATTPFIYKGTATLGEYLVDHYKTTSVERPVKAE